MAAPAPGTVLRLPLTASGGDDAQVRVLADLDRDLAPHARTDRRWPLSVLGSAVLVDVVVDGRTVLPGAWVEHRALADLERLRAERLRPEDLRMPAVVLGEGSEAVLAWGETIWPLPFDASVRIPATCRPGIHSLAELRRLALTAAGRRSVVGLTLWRAPGFAVPWHDVRLDERARWWFEMAQVPPGMRYAGAADTQGVPVRRFLNL